MLMFMHRMPSCSIGRQMAAGHPFRRFCRTFGRPFKGEKMRFRFAASALVLSVSCAGSFAAVSSVDLGNYVRVGRYALPDVSNTPLPAGTPVHNLLAQEASGVAYNHDTDTLFIIGDGGRSITQVSKTGQLIDTMTLALQTGAPQGTAFYDPEGITYVGNNQFVFTEEREREVTKVTYVANTTVGPAQAQTVKLGTTIGNIGLEGISYDPATSGFLLAKEATPRAVFQTTVDFAAGTASNGSATTVNSVDLFPGNLPGLTDIADVFAFSNLPSLAGLADYNNLLLISQEDAAIVEMDRSGNVLSRLDITSDIGDTLLPADLQHEGLTMDRNGFLYVVNENGGGNINNPQLWVFAPRVPEPTSALAIAAVSLITRRRR